MVSSNWYGYFYLLLYYLFNIYCKLHKRFCTFLPPTTVCINFFLFLHLKNLSLLHGYIYSFEFTCLKNYFPNSCILVELPVWKTCNHVKWLWQNYSNIKANLIHTYRLEFGYELVYFMDRSENAIINYEAILCLEKPCCEKRLRLFIS